MVGDQEQEVRAYYEAWLQGKELMESILDPLSPTVQNDTIQLLEDFAEEMAEEFITANEEAYIKFVVGWATVHPIDQSEFQERN